MPMNFFFSPVLGQAADAMSIGALVLIIGIAFFAALAFSALFIHVAAGMLGFAQTFGTAMRAVLWQILFVFIFGILFSIGAAVLPALAPVAALLAHWTGSAFGIRQAYTVNFFRALVAAIISAILTTVAAVVVVIIVVVAMGLSMKQLQDEIQKRKPATTISAELETPSSRERYTLIDRPLFFGPSFSKNGTACSAHCVAVG